MLFLLAIPALLQASDTALTAEIQKALRVVPIERALSRDYETRVLGAIEADLDRDGVPEAVAWIAPMLRQTPTILIFRRDVARKDWNRLIEGLEPGDLEEVHSARIDLHTLGDGIDMSAGNPADSTIAKLFAAGAKSGTSLVAYKGFLHADRRNDATFVLDLRGTALPNEGTLTCEQFEFSDVDAVAFGPVVNGAASMLVTLTRHNVTLYRIDSISAVGTLVMHSWIQPRPAGVTGLKRTPSGTIVLTKTSGTAPIAAPGT